MNEKGNLGSSLLSAVHVEIDRRIRMVLINYPNSNTGRLCIRYLLSSILLMALIYCGLSVIPL